MVNAGRFDEGRRLAFFPQSAHKLARRKNTKSY